MHGNLQTKGASLIDEVALGLVREAIEKSNGKPRNEVFPEFVRLLRKDTKAQREVDWYFFANMHSYLTGNRSRWNPEKAEERAAQRREAVESIKQQIMLMKLVLPSGKLVEEATFGELAQAGGWYAKAAKLGKPNQIVGKTITEAALQKIK